MMRRLGPALFSWSNLAPLLATLVYLINRFAFSLDCVLPYEFVNYHLADLCGGIVFPAYVNVLTRVVSGREIICGLGSSLLLSALCAACWEVLASCVLHFGTADPIDALMYFLGGLVYLAFYKILPREGKAAPRTPAILPAGANPTMPATNLARLLNAWYKIIGG